MSWAEISAALERAEKALTTAYSALTFYASGEQDGGERAREALGWKKGWKQEGNKDESQHRREGSPGS